MTLIKDKNIGGILFDFETDQDAHDDVVLNVKARTGEVDKSAQPNGREAVEETARTIMGDVLGGMRAKFPSARKAAEIADSPEGSLQMDVEAIALGVSTQGVDGHLKGVIADLQKKYAGKGR